MSAPVRKAVILAAGMGTRLNADIEHLGPKGFLSIGEKSLIRHSVERLLCAGIEHIVIVTGHMSDWYDELADASDGMISTVHNPRYHESGSMYSLYCVRGSIDEDFLLLESDLIYERRALECALHSKFRDCVLLSGLSQSHDEVFVQTANSKLVAMSKNRAKLGQVSGEFVGICKMSMPLFTRMCDAACGAFDTDLNVDYETDCLVRVARHYPVPCRTVFDLAWAEVDDLQHLERARDEIYPLIQERNRSRPAEPALYSTANDLGC